MVTLFVAHLFTSKVSFGVKQGPDNENTTGPCVTQPEIFTPLESYIAHPEVLPEYVILALLLIDPPMQDTRRQDDIVTTSNCTLSETFLGIFPPVVEFAPTPTRNTTLLLVKSYSAWSSPDASVFVVVDIFRLPDKNVVPTGILS